MISALAVSLLMTLFLTGILCGAEDPGDGVQSAAKWLTLVDSRNYQPSWASAAEIFKTSISAAQWEQTIAAVRDPIGELIRRELVEQQFATQMPALPDGQYLIIQYKSTFANKAQAIETVTVMKDPDGYWRVAGYFIK
jgi:hypothetical protein